jgi:hypothetical protein
LRKTNNQCPMPNRRSPIPDPRSPIPDPRSPNHPTLAAFDCGQVRSKC